MSALNLMLHCGGFEVAREELVNLPTPEATATHRPIAHADFVNMVQDEIEAVGLRIVAEAHGVTKSAQGGNYFGMLQVAGTALQADDHATIVGLRNANNKRFPAGIAIGSGVFVCDNLAFFGDHMGMRKHTRHALDESIGIRPMIRETIGRVIALSEVQENRFEAYKRGNLLRGEAEVLMIEMLRAGVVSTQQLPKVVQQWDTPDHEEFARNRNGWRMFNAVTEALKGSSPMDLPRRTAALHRMLDQHFGLIESPDDDVIDYIPADLSEALTV